ncbi:MAG: hypothetical protein K0U98_00860 [Deltaproteobacteria bacterium]|nr:hypothetical protein [Deltaproteobacteria bacterium]
MEEFSFWQEVLKEAIASAFAALVLVIGAWVTFFRSMRENRRKHVQEMEAELEKQRAERREAYATETLVTAYRNLHALLMRENPLMLGHDKLGQYRIKAEDALRDIQLLGNKESAELAQKIGESVDLLNDQAFMSTFFITLRSSLRDRLQLQPVDGTPSFVRFLDDDKILSISDMEISAINPDLLNHKRMLQQQRGLPVDSLPASESI